MLNSYGCIASVDYITGLYSAMKLVFLHLGRLIQDLQFWSAFEVGQLYVPNSLVQISSIMPQKRNPVPIEHLRHLASATAGRCDLVVNTMHNTPFTDMNDSEGEVQQAGYSAFDSGTRFLQLLAAVLPACSINADNVRRNLDAACATVTELADTLVRNDSVTFRQAHGIAAKTAKNVIAKGQPLKSGFAAFQAAFQAEMSRASSLDEADYGLAVSPETFVARRDRQGGPAPNALSAALQSYVEAHETLVAATLARSSRHAAAAEALDAAYDALLET